MQLYKCLRRYYACMLFAQEDHYDLQI
jgi:hypothetical protein